MRPRRSQILFFLPLSLAACVHHTRPAPALSPPAAPVAQASASTQKSLLTRTADATWDVVSAPARLVTPQKKAPPEPAPVYQAPEAIIMTPATDDVPAPATQPK